MTQVLSFDGRADFQARLQRLNQDIAAMRDIKVEKPSVLDRIGMGLRMAVLIAVAGLALKATFVSYVGTQAYGAHVAALAQGSLSDRLSAMVMQPDPVTGAIADGVRQVIFEQAAPSLDEKAHAAVNAAADAAKASSQITGLGMAIVKPADFAAADRHPLKVSATGRVGSAGTFVSVPNAAPAQSAQPAQLLH